EGVTDEGDQGDPPPRQLPADGLQAEAVVQRHHAEAQRGQHDRQQQALARHAGHVFADLVIGDVARQQVQRPQRQHQHAHRQQRPGDAPQQHRPLAGRAQGIIRAWHLLDFFLLHATLVSLGGTWRAVEKQPDDSIHGWIVRRSITQVIDRRSRARTVRRPRYPTSLEQALLQAMNGVRDHCADVPCPMRAIQRYISTTLATNTMPPIQIAAPWKPSPTSASGALRLAKPSLSENATSAATITPSRLSPTIRPEASSTPSCLVGSGLGPRSARLSNQAPTSAPTTTISVVEVGRYMPSPTASGGRRTDLVVLASTASSTISATPMPAPRPIRL